MVKLSVIIPYYNGEKWIAKCLDSLLHQDLGEDEYEIIVVDDGSTKSSEVLKNYVQSHQNIHYILQENKGVSAARNKGLSIAEGEFIFFCDCDDFITEDVLGRLYDIAKSNDVDLLFFDYKVILEGERLQPVLDFGDITIYNPGINLLLTPPYKAVSCAWEYVISRDYIEKRQLLFSEEQKTGEDYYYYLDIMKDVGRIGKVRADVYNWVMHSSSLTHLSGKDLAKRYDNFAFGLYLHLQHLVEFKRSLLEKHEVPIQTVKVLNDLKDQEAFVLLINYFKHLPLKENCGLIEKLTQLGIFPICHRFIVNKKRLSNRKKQIQIWVCRLMNIRFLWLIACALFHCVPKKRE